MNRYYGYYSLLLIFRSPLLDLFSFRSDLLCALCATGFFALPAIATRVCIYIYIYQLVRNRRILYHIYKQWCDRQIPITVNHRPAIRRAFIQTLLLVDRSSIIHTHTHTHTRAYIHTHAHIHVIARIIINSSIFNFIIFSRSWNRFNHGFNQSIGINFEDKLSIVRIVDEGTRLEDSSVDTIIIDPRRFIGS